MVSELRHNRNLVLLHLRQVTPSDLIFRQNVIQQIPGVLTLHPISGRNIRNTLDLIFKLLPNRNTTSRQSRPGDRRALSHRQRRISNALVHVLHHGIGVVPEALNLRPRRVNTHQAFEPQHCGQPTNSSDSPANRRCELRDVHADVTDVLAGAFEALTDSDHSVAHTTHPVTSVLQAGRNTLPHAHRLLRLRRRIIKRLLSVF